MNKPTELKPSYLDFSSFCFRFGHSICMAKYDDKKQKLYEYNTHVVKLKDINKALVEYQKYLKQPLPPNSYKCPLCGKEKL